MDVEKNSQKNILGVPRNTWGQTYKGSDFAGRAKSLKT